MPRPEPGTVNTMNPQHPGGRKAGDRPATIHAAHAPLLVVASLRRWVADELQTAAAAAGVRLTHSWGLDIPAGADTAAWWTPTEHAARLIHSGVPMPLYAPGPEWLSSVPEPLTGRPVWSGPLSRIGEAPPRGFAKPAEMKLETVPAAWWEDTTDFAAAVRQAGASPDSWVQVSPTRLNLCAEFRTFVRHGHVVATSAYLHAGETYTDGMEADPALDHATARSFAQHVVDEMGQGQPPTYVLDVALAATGDWLVLEANPAWSSAFYGCDRGQVISTLIACRLPLGQAASPWLWRPDPYLSARAARARPLPHPLAPVP